MVCQGRGSLNLNLGLYYTNEENKDFYLYKQQTNKLIYYGREYSEDTRYEGRTEVCAV